jgi:hypothetical protein
MHLICTDAFKEEEKKMPYITSIEQMGIQQGIQQKAREAVIEILDPRFEGVPQSESALSEWS